jgi:broad specificity phosphatase PhoE
MELFLIRHGQSLGNVAKDDDMPDPPLSELGRIQAEQVAAHMRGFRITDIVSSPLIRALQTAQPLARALGLPINVWTNTYEVRVLGPYLGPNAGQLLEQFPEACFDEGMGPQGWFCSGDETPEAALARAKTVIAALLRNFPERRVAMFAHNAFNRYLLLAALGLDHRSTVQFRQKNGCINWLTFAEGKVKVNLLGYDNHLM